MYGVGGQEEPKVIRTGATVLGAIGDAAARQAGAGKARQGQPRQREAEARVQKDSQLSCCYSGPSVSFSQATERKWLAAHS